MSRLMSLPYQWLSTGLNYIKPDLLPSAIIIEDGNDIYTFAIRKIKRLSETTLKLETVVVKTEKMIWIKEIVNAEKHDKNKPTIPEHIKAKARSKINTRYCIDFF
jgi:hypothetical protein